MAVDITINETIDLVDITVNPNIIEVNVTRTSGGGGSQTLAQTLDLGNQTGGENILVNNADAIELENTSLLKKGSYDFGGDGGISRICSVGFEDMWQAGIRHVFDNNGLLRHSTNCFDIIPDSSFDNTLRFKVDSLWTLDDGTTYKCTDASTGAAVWEIYNSFIPNLTQVVGEGDISVFFQQILEDEVITIPLSWQVSQSYVYGEPTIGTGGVFLDKTVIFSDNATLRICWGIQYEDGAYTKTPEPFEFTTDAIVYYNGAPITSLTIQPNDLVMLKSGGIVSPNENIWILTITNQSTGGGTIPTTTSQLTNDGADGVNPFITALDIPVAGEASTLVREVKNMTGATLTKGTVVFISGANGNKALVSKAIATTDALSARTFGLLQSDILNNGLGNCVVIGDLSGINTSSFAEGAQLYLSGVTAGAFTDVRTLAPTHLVYIGKVTRSHPTQGQIEVQIQNFPELEEIHDVQIVTPLNNQALVYETSSELWKNKTIIEDNLTASTTIAPSKTAVISALDFTRKLITNGSGSVTGTTAETILTTLTIPANTLDSKCFIWTTMDYFKTGSGGCNLKLYINSSNSLSGATLVGLVVFGSNRNGSFNRKFYLNGTTLDLLLTNTAISQINNEFIEGLFGASTTLTVNPAANIFLIYTTQNDSVGTTANGKIATVQKMKLN